MMACEELKEWGTMGREQQRLERARPQRLASWVEGMSASMAADEAAEAVEE